MKTSLLLLVALFAACGTDPAQQSVIVPELAIIAGDVQTDTVGRTLPTALAAKLVDRQTGQPLAGRVLNWIVLDGGGSVFAPFTQTALDGTARQSWTLGMQAGRQRLVARWLDPETGEPVTLDTAVATALPNWNLAVSIANQTDTTALFQWAGGGSASGRDIIPAHSSRCERLLVRADSANVTVSIAASYGTAFSSSNWFAPSTSDAWAATVTQSSPPSVMLTIGAGC